MEPKQTSPDQPGVADLSDAPLPTRKTLAQRRSVPYQATRFVAMNVRILRMALKGH